MDAEQGANGAGPLDRAELLAFVDAALARAASVRHVRARVSVGLRPRPWPDGFLPPARAATVRVDMIGPADEHVDHLLATDVRAWLADAARPPRLLATTQPTTFGSALVAFGFRRLEVYRDERLLEVRPLGAARSWRT